MLSRGCTMCRTVVMSAIRGHLAQTKGNIRQPCRPKVLRADGP